MRWYTISGMECGGAVYGKSDDCRIISNTTKGNNDVVCLGYEGELIKDAVRGE